MVMRMEGLPLLEWKGGHVDTKFLEGAVDGQHSLAFAHVRLGAMYFRDAVRVQVLLSVDEMLQVMRLQGG